MNEKVNFGSRKVLKTKKTKLVSDIFSSVSNKYDLMNDAMSFGLHRLWKERMYVVSKLKNSDNVLDLATGTGDIALKFLSKKKLINITCLDENQEMLDICKNRLIDNGFVQNIEFIKSSAETTNFKENSYTLATIAFGFRNFTDHLKSLENIYKSLMPGGRLVIMEFTTPENKLVKNKKFQTNGTIDFINGQKNFLSNRIYNLIPRVGDLMVFPNYLMHTAYPFNVNGERRSFSFNVKITFKK